MNATEKKIQEIKSKLQKDNYGMYVNADGYINTKVDCDIATYTIDSKPANRLTKFLLSINKLLWQKVRH